MNNAGVAGAAPATREAPEHFRRIIEINLNGSYSMAQAAGARRVLEARIINVGSVLGLMTAGLASGRLRILEAAIIGLTRDLAQQVDEPERHSN